MFILTQSINNNGLYKKCFPIKKQEDDEGLLFKKSLATAVHFTNFLTAHSRQDWH